MCYSAQIQAAYLKYLRETGAEMDVDNTDGLYRGGLPLKALAEAVATVTYGHVGAITSAR